MDLMLVRKDINLQFMGHVSCVQITQEFRMMENLAFQHAMTTKRFLRVVSVKGAGNRQNLQEIVDHVNNQPVVKEKK